MKAIVSTLVAACLLATSPAYARDRHLPWHPIPSNGWAHTGHLRDWRHDGGGSEAAGLAIVGVAAAVLVLGALMEASNNAPLPVIPAVDHYDPRSPTGLASDAKLRSAGWPRSVSVDP